MPIISNMGHSAAFFSHRPDAFSLLRATFLCGLISASATLSSAQSSGSLGNGLSAAATARGGSVVTATDSPVDAVEGNPAGLAGLSTRTLEVSALGLVAGGSFKNAANTNAKLRGVAGAFPFGAFATPIGHTPWTASAAVTPEILMRANWHYVDAPGTAGVTYGYQTRRPRSSPSAPPSA